MGACVYKIGVAGAPVLGDPGYREYFGRRRGFGPVMFELRRVSSAYNEARKTALARLREQAARAGAHLVVGVELRLNEGEVAGIQTVEYVVSGTAVRFTERAATTAPHLSPLSITGCWLLREVGYEPIGLAATTAVCFTRPGSVTASVLGKRRRSAPPNQELPDLSAAATSARDICQARLRIARNDPHRRVGLQ